MLLEVDPDLLRPGRMAGWLRIFGKPIGVRPTAECEVTTSLLNLHQLPFGLGDSQNAKTAMIQATTEETAAKAIPTCQGAMSADIGKYPWSMH